MQIVKANPEKKEEKLSKLSTLTHGAVFRFRDTLFEDALVAENTAFYMVINKPASTVDRVSVLSLDGKTILERDGEHMVHQHQATISVSPNI